MTTLYFGRNIGEDELGYYLTFNTSDLKSAHDKTYGKSHFKTYAKALAQLKYQVSNGSTWFDAHFDPTI